MNYWVLSTTRNRCDLLKRSLSSILDQDLSPRGIIIFADGCSDGTTELLKDLKTRLESRLTVLWRKDEGYDITRVAKNWNSCFSAALSSKLFERTTYTWITADDCLYPPDYARGIIERMDEDSELAVASGTRGISVPMDGWKPPEGSGRFLRNRYLKSIGFQVPERCGYESWLVYEAMRQGFKVACFDDMKYEHAHALGRSHAFQEWGWMAWSLGYDPLFFLGRCARNLSTGLLPRTATLKILGTYLYAHLRSSSNPFYRKHEEPTRNFVRAFQRNRLKKLLRMKS